MKIALLGDTALFGKFCLETGSPYSYLKPIANLLKEFDFVILNLETPFAGKSATPFGNKSAHIKSNPININILKFLNVSAVNLANNHIFDYGLDSYNLTKQILEKNNIEYFGIENRQTLIELNRNKIALSGFCCYSTNPIGIGSNGINVLDYKITNDIISKNLSKGYNNIVSVHAGEEHVNYPNIDHIKLARLFSDTNPYVFYGHHPHVLQGFENYKESLHLFSLGNFCFDDVYTKKSKLPLVKISENNKKSVIVVLEYENNKLIKNKYIPLYDALPCTQEKEKKILSELSNYSKQLCSKDKQYILKRSKQLNSYLNDRKKKRNFAWYINRLNFNSVRLILNAKFNYRKYKIHVSKYVN